MSSSLYRTGTITIGAAAAGGIFRAFKRGWQKPRGKRLQREELLAPLGPAAEY
jgi:hypothetical protein